MATIDRKSSLRKAAAVDVVDSLTARTEAPAPKADVPPLVEARPATVHQEPVATRGPGPGRPRSKRRMEPFSSKIEIELRDELDAYIEANGITITDFLDEAIRDRLKK